jgi:hypothetical protein
LGNVRRDDPGDLPLRADRREHNLDGDGAHAVLQVDQKSVRFAERLKRGEG